jgi:two-component system response regulator QseB
MAKVLLVEDDTANAESVAAFLRKKEQHAVDWAADGVQALEFLNVYNYDVIIIDWELPLKSGIELLTEYRNKGGNAPALFLTGRTAVADKTHSLDLGADDYLCKPFDMAELGARVRALLRRQTGRRQNILQAGDVVLDTKAHTVRKQDELVHLTPLEFSLLEFLIRHKGTMFKHEALLDRVWDSSSDAGIDMVRTTIKRIRRKLGEVGKQSTIRNVFGEGYIVEAGDAANNSD